MPGKAFYRTLNVRLEFSYLNFRYQNNACMYPLWTSNNAWERKVKLSIQNNELKVTTHRRTCKSLRSFLDFI